MSDLESSPYIKLTSRLPHAPVGYIRDFAVFPDRVLQSLQEELNWVRHSDAPRSEYYCNDVMMPYTYGRGNGRRTYHPQPWHPVILDIRSRLEEETKCKFEVCFLNRYLNQSDSLGWHADDSPEMDDARPIGVVSFGAEREIWFRRKGEKQVIDKLKLHHGSLCLMKPLMQDAWEHRIPKASFQCGERISLTFRGYVKGEG